MKQRQRNKCINSSSQVQSLPSPALQQIIEEVAGFGRFQIDNLRLSSKFWRTECDAEIQEVTCRALRWNNAMPFVSSLLKLRHLTVRGEAFTVIAVRGDAFMDLEGRLLKSFRFAGYLAGDHANDSNLIVEDFGENLHPWLSSLERIQITYCVVVRKLGPNNLYDPVFFSSFLNLSDLQLVGLDFRGAITSNFIPLRLANCTKLRNLDCSSSSFTWLELTGCTQLKTLKCSHTKLLQLDVSACPLLTTLDCSYSSLTVLHVGVCPYLILITCCVNQLKKLDLSSCTTLRCLVCSENQLTTLMLPVQARLAVIISSSNVAGVPTGDGEFGLLLRCDGSSFSLLSAARLAEISSLHVDGLVECELTGFVALKRLQCSLGRLGAIDVAGCAAVGLSIFSQTYDISLEGRGAVQALALSGFFGLSSFEGFTALTHLELRCIVNEPNTLDFSACTQLLELNITSECPSSMILFINVSGCFFLQKFHCRNLPIIYGLDLSMCVALVDIKCVNCSLRKLDVSCCMQLVSVDVSGCYRFALLDASVLLKNWQVTHNSRSTVYVSRKIDGKVHVEVLK